jgi:hypothetical protein
MANQLTLLLNTILSRITNKTAISSISPADVGNTDSDILRLCLLVQLADIAQTYAAGQTVRDSSYNMYIALLNDVNGDITNTTNWIKYAGPGTASGAVKKPFTITADGSTTIYVFTHSLNTYNIVPSLLQSSDTSGAAPFVPQGMDGITFPTANTVRVDLGRYDKTFGLVYQLTCI